MAENVQETTDNAQSGNARLVLWLIVMSMSFLVIPIFLAASIIEEERMILEEDLGAIQSELEATPEVDPEIERLESEMLTLRNDTSTLQDLHESLLESDIDWTLLMHTFIDFDHQGMELTAITQNARRITLNGRADDEADLMAYVDVLQDSGLFEQVLLQSISRNLPETDEDGNPLPEHRLVEFVIQTDLEDIPS